MHAVFSWSIGVAGVRQYLHISADEEVKSGSIEIVYLSIDLII